MAILKIKDETGKFVDIPAIQGAPGKDGAIQYEAGENIKIDGNVISADIPDTDENIIPIVRMSGVYIPGWSSTKTTYSSTVNNGEQIRKVSETINHIYNKGYANCGLELMDSFGYIRCVFYPVASDVTNANFASQKTAYRLTGITFGKVNGTTTFNLSVNNVIGYIMTVSGKWVDDVFTCTNCTIERTTPYATKAYVDNAITTTLEGEY